MKKLKMGEIDDWCIYKSVFAFNYENLYPFLKINVLNNIFCFNNSFIINLI